MNNADVLGLGRGADNKVVRGTRWRLEVTDKKLRVDSLCELSQEEQ